MAQDFHNPEESAYELISRLRKEAKGKTDYKKVNYVPHPTYRRNGKGAMKKPTVALFKFRRFIRIPMEVMGMKLSTLLMGVSTLLALAIVAIGLTIFFAHTPAGSPAEVLPPQDPYLYTLASYEDEDEAYNDYDEYQDYEDEYLPYEDETEDDVADDEDNEDEEDTASSPTRQEIAVAIRPHIAALRTQLELVFDPMQWASIIEELAQEAYTAYHALESGTEQWQAFVIEYTQSSFLESEWAATIADAPEEVEEDEEDDDDDAPTTPTPQETPQPTNPPTPEPPPPEPQIVFVTLTSSNADHAVDVTVPMINNQVLLDLLVQDFYLRLAVNDPARFPHNANGMTTWANQIVTLYLAEGQAGAEYRLRRNISALERAEIAQQYVPYS